MDSFSTVRTVKLGGKDIPLGLAREIRDQYEMCSRLANALGCGLRELCEVLKACHVSLTDGDAEAFARDVVHLDGLPDWYSAGMYPVDEGAFELLVAARKLGIDLSPSAAADYLRSDGDCC